MFIILDAKRETWSINIKTTKKEGEHARTIHSSIDSESCFMKPSVHPNQIEPAPKQQAFKFQDPLRN